METNPQNVGGFVIEYRKSPLIKGETIEEILKQVGEYLENVKSEGYPKLGDIGLWFECTVSLSPD